MCGVRSVSLEEEVYAVAASVYMLDFAEASGSNNAKAQNQTFTSDRIPFIRTRLGSGFSVSLRKSDNGSHFSGTQKHVSRKQLRQLRLPRNHLAPHV